MHRGMNPARVGRLAGETQVAIWIPDGEISGGIETPDWKSGNGGEFGLALRTFFERGAERVFFPSAFFRGGLALYGWNVSRRDGRDRTLDLVAHGLTLLICPRLGAFFERTRERPARPSLRPVLAEEEGFEPPRPFRA